jgi:hypothetical protein
VRTWLALACVSLLGCSTVSTDVFDESADAAVTDDTGSTDTSVKPDGVVEQDTAVEPDTWMADTWVTPDTGVKPDTAVDTRPDTLVDTMPDTMPDTTPDGAVTYDNIQCGTGASAKTCTPGTQDCCVTTSSAGRTYTCTAVGATCTGVNLACDDVADCIAQGKPNTVCCGALVNGGTGGVATVSNSTCQAASTCTNMNNRVIICDPKETNPCPNGGMCTLSSQTIPGYYICR